MIQAEFHESKQGVFDRLRKAPGSGVTELQFGPPERVHAVCFDGVSWSLHRLSSDDSPRRDVDVLYTAGSLRELMAFLDTRWPLN